MAFCFGALLESCAGFGAPVAVTAFLLTGLGVAPFRAVLIALVANTAPVAFGGMGIPVVALAGVTGLDLSALSAMVGRQVPLLSLVVPAYLAWIVSGADGLRRTWPAAVIAGVSFAAAQGARGKPVGAVRGRYHRVARVDRGHRHVAAGLVPIAGPEPTRRTRLEPGPPALARGAARQRRVTRRSTLGA